MMSRSFFITRPPLTPRVVEPPALASLPGDPEEPLSSNPTHRKMCCARPLVWRIQPECDTSWSKHRPCQAPRREFRRSVGWESLEPDILGFALVVRDVALEATYRQCNGHHLRQGSNG